MPPAARCSRFTASMAARELDEREVPSLAGYRGMGPVRIGNLAYRQVQHDVYGSAILAATHIFFDQRLTRRGDEALFRRLELLGEQAAALLRPAGRRALGIARQRPRPYLFSRDVLGRLRPPGADRRQAGAGRARRLLARSGRPDPRDDQPSEPGTKARPQLRLDLRGRGDGCEPAAARRGRLPRRRPTRALRPRSAAVEKDLRRGDFIFRYVEKDDFGEPENAFLVCTFWYVNALAALGRRDEARALFEKLLACRNRHGLLAEHIDPRTGEQWGNFVQTYSMVGLINAAIRLSIRWDQAF